MTAMYLTVNEVSDVMRVTRKTVRRWIRGGQLPAKRIGKKYAIPAKAVVGDDATSAAPCERNQNPSDFAAKAVDSYSVDGDPMPVESPSAETVPAGSSAFPERKEEPGNLPGARPAGSRATLDMCDSDGPSR